MTASTASATGSALALHSDCQWQIVFKFDSDSARESESVTVRPSQWHSGSGCSLRVLASGQCSAPN